MASNVLGGFVDAVVQKLENCRAGLPADLEAAVVERYMLELYDAERPRLHEAVQALAPIVDETSLVNEEDELDALFRRVLLPAYSRGAGELTRRERNDFYIASKGLHGLERFGWAAGGTLLGTFVVWAPFIPIWSKEAILPFAMAGLFFPELRRYFAYRRYAREVNGLVGKVETEARRLQSVYLDAPTVMERLESHEPRKLPTGQTEGH
ncbi:MAG: hypothetical protein ABI321_21050 [Polyangia bacterium]